MAEISHVRIAVPEQASLNRILREGGSQLFPQVSSRPIGLVTGLSGYHAFLRRPTYMRLAALPLAERVKELAKPAVKAAIMAEDDVRVEEPGSMANLYALFQTAAPVIQALRIRRPQLTESKAPPGTERARMP